MIFCKLETLSGRGYREDHCRRFAEGSLKLIAHVILFFQPGESVMVVSLVTVKRFLNSGKDRPYQGKPGSFSIDLLNQ